MFEWYRVRWQVELAFKRMKSVMGLGELPKSSDASGRAWIHGKLLVALLLGRLLAADSFSSHAGELAAVEESVAGSPVHAP